MASEVEKPDKNPCRREVIDEHASLPACPWGAQRRNPQTSSINDDEHGF